MLRVIVTGSGGFIGRRLARELSASGHDVVGLDTTPPSDPTGALRCLLVDVLDADRVEEVFQAVNPEVVFHLAGVTSHDAIVGNPERALQVAVTGTMNCLASFVRAEARCFVFASTGKVYGSIRYTPIDEAHPCCPRNILGRTKLVVENLIACVASLGGRSYVAARLFNVYGPGQNEQFVVPTILRQLAGGGSLVTLGNTTDARDYVFVDDVVRALCLIGEKTHCPGFHVLNIGSGKPTSVASIVAELERALGHSISISVDSSRFRHDEDSVEFADIRLARETLGWNPSISLADGLRATSERYFSSGRCR